MVINFGYLNVVEQTKMCLLLQTLDELGFDLSSNGGYGINVGNGDVYVWIEGMDCDFFVPVNVELRRENVRFYILGIKEEYPLLNMNREGLEAFIKERQKENEND